MADAADAEGDSQRLAPLGAAVVAAAEGAASLSRRTVAALEEAGVRAMLPSGFDETPLSREKLSDERKGEGENRKERFRGSTHRVPRRSRRRRFFTTHSRCD